MDIGRWSLCRRTDGDFSLYERVSICQDGSQDSLEVVERARMSIGLLWVSLSLLGKLLWTVRDVLLWLSKRKKRRSHR